MLLVLPAAGTVAEERAAAERAHVLAYRLAGVLGGCEPVGETRRRRALTSPDRDS